MTAPDKIDPVGSPKKVTKLYDGFTFVDPTATTQEVANALLPTGEEGTGSAFQCRITTDRRRVLDRATGKRVTRAWRAAYFVLWNDETGATAMGRHEMRQIYQDAQRLGADEIVVFGRSALISGPNISFRQFAVRDLASIPDEPAARGASSSPSPSPKGLG